MKTCLTLILSIFFSSTFAQSINDYYDIGLYAKAIEAFQSIKNPQPEDQITLAKVYAAKGMTNACLQAYHKALKNTKPNEFITSKFQYAKALQTQNKLTKADSLYSSLLEIMPENAEIYYQKGKISEALEITAYHQLYLTALLYDPTHIKAAHEAGRYFMEVDNLKMAKNICLKTLEKIPHTPRLINLLAQIHYREGDYKTSLGYIQELESLKSDLPKFIYEIKGNNYLKLNQYKAALKAFETAFFMDRFDYKLCLKIGEIALLVNDLDKSEKYFMNYKLLRDTSMSEFNFLMGKLHMAQKRYHTAFFHFEKVLKEKTGHEGARYYRAVAADNFAEDKSYVLDYYTNYIEFFEDVKDAKYVDIALRRETEIRRELFMKE